jgi:ATP-dependent DNA ligase
MGDCMVHKAVEPKNLSKALQASTDVLEWVISPKYDGCHVIFAFDNGKLVNVFSRQGETVRSMQHVAEALVQAYKLGNGRIAVCGEAWVVGTPFAEISGMFRRHSMQPQLCFVPFDCVPFDYTEDATDPPILLGQANHVKYPTTYGRRIGTLREWMAQPAFPCLIKPTFHTFRGTLAEAWAFVKPTALHYKGNEFAHYDGAILARADGKYIVGAGKGGEFIKVKPLVSETVTVATLFPAVGEKTGKNTLALGFTFNGRQQRVSTGLTQKEVDAYIADNSLIVGKRIEVEAMGVTEEGSFREPRFKGIRTDA